ncbi:MAG: hypothetical protein LJE84_12655 [Gammaproteobacteria bacterium]|nr:hypothetical protein [Gammaproteobacteria bacterium]
MPACIVRPAMTEGPYFVDTPLQRPDIRSDPADGSLREGEPLELAIRVAQVDAAGCAPLAGAQVDLWHCDAKGVYSGVSDPGFGNTARHAFLRGYQFTNADGVARFITCTRAGIPAAPCTSTSRSVRRPSTGTTTSRPSSFSTIPSRPACLRRHPTAAVIPAA